MLKSAVPGALKNITLRNFDIFLQDDEAYKPDWHRYRGDYVLDTQNVEGLTLDRVRIFASEKELSKWDGKFNAEDCPDMLMKDCNF